MKNLSLLDFHLKEYILYAIGWATVATTLAITYGYGKCDDKISKTGGDSRPADEKRNDISSTNAAIQKFFEKGRGTVPSKNS